MSFGNITTEHTVWCAICRQWQQESIRRMVDFQRTIREAGWEMRKGKWVCSQCIDQGMDESL